MYIYKPRLHPPMRYANHHKVTTQSLPIPGQPNHSSTHPVQLCKDHFSGSWCTRKADCTKISGRKGTANGNKDLGAKWFQKQTCCPLKMRHVPSVYLLSTLQIGKKKVGSVMTNHAMAYGSGRPSPRTFPIAAKLPVQVQEFSRRAPTMIQLEMQDLVEQSGLERSLQRSLNSAKNQGLRLLC